ncbi:MAG: nucleotidyl transferase AbiEii/AbiGii toxin family protein [Candidatus Melainabacteria bacterium]|nr:nucleotidyl transferase AbiEii/AbiGii toxin family protein [Candidatus Melainabacteria bacterium]
MKYDSLSEYLDALEQRIELVSAGNEILRLDLQKDMAMERLTARFDPAKLAVKGGFGVRTLVPGGPLTQDLDILINNNDWQGLTKERIYQLVGDYVLEQMATEGPDKFKFTPTSAAPFSDMGPEQAAVRIWAQVSVGDKSFGAVIIDAGLKDPSVPVEQHTGRDVLGFAEIENPIITTPSREWLAADKLTLLLENGWEGDRPRDAVHGALLLEKGRYDEAVLAQWLEKFADSRGVLALLTEPLEQPSKIWTMQVNQICSRNGLMMTAEICFERISCVLDRLFGRDR